MEQKYRILAVDDDKTVAFAMAALLRNAGYRVDTAETGEEALSRASRMQYDCFLLDINLPFMSGFELCDLLLKDSEAPVIFLTCRSHVEDVVAGFNHGAIDYVTKPPSSKELLARVRSAIQRSGAKVPASAGKWYSCGICVDEQTHSVAVNGDSIEFPRQEYELLLYLIQRAGTLVSREDLMRGAWGWSYHPDSKTVEAHICRVRSRLKKAGCKDDPVETVRGYGYRFKPSD